MPIYVKRLGADLPRLEIICSGNGSAVDFTDSTGVRFLFRPRYTGSPAAFSITGGFASRTSGSVFMNLNVATGANQLNTRGPYLFYIQTLWSGNGIQVFPDQGYFHLHLYSGLI